MPHRPARIASVAALCSALAVPLLSLPSLSAPPAETVIGDAAHAQWAPYGNGRATNAKAPDLPGGVALRLQVRRKGAQPWDAGLSVQLKDGVQAGERVIAGFYARAQSPAPGRDTATVIARVQQNGQSYDPVIEATFEIGPEWRFHCVQGAAKRGFGAGALELGLQLASEQQTVEVGPFMVVRGGEGERTQLPCERRIAAQ